MIGAATGAETIGGALTNPAEAKATYTAVYSNLGLTAMGIAVVMLALTPVIKKLMGDAALEQGDKTTQLEGGEETVKKDPSQTRG